MFASLISYRTPSYGRKLLLRNVAALFGSRLRELLCKFVKEVGCPLYIWRKQGAFVDQPDHDEGGTYHGSHPGDEEGKFWRSEV